MREQCPKKIQQKVEEESEDGFEFIQGPFLIAKNSPIKVDTKCILNKYQT